MGNRAGAMIERSVTWPVLIGVLVLVTGCVPGTVAAFDAEPSFAKGTWIASMQVGGGAQADIDNHFSGITYLDFMPRVSYLPFSPFGSGWYRAALEPGLEAWLEHYLAPQQANAGGMKAALRLHAIGFGRIVPYLELTAGAGATGLRVPESLSTFTFILEGGVGVSVFFKPDLSINVGYRIQHLSNGNTSKPNRGYEANSGVIGVNFFFR
jgi:Lipid A 3-O-deacylase (PagL)